MSAHARLPLGVTAVMLPELDFAEQLSLCAELGLRYYVYRPRIIAQDQRNEPFSNWGNHKFDLTPQRLFDEGATLQQQIREAGLEPFGTVPHTHITDDDATLKLHFEGAARAGAKSVRVAPEPYPQSVFDYDAYVQRVVDRYRYLVTLAQPHGLKIVMEMHCNTSVCGPGLAYNIVRHFDPAELGLIFDLPNFAREGMVNPVLAVSAVARWIDHCHVGGLRRTAGEYDALGFRNAGFQMCALAESDLHIPAWLEALVQLDREVPLILEDYTAGVPGKLRLQTTAEATKRAIAGLEV